MLKFDDAGLHIFNTDLGAMGLSWTPRGVNRFMLGRNAEDTRQWLEDHEPGLSLVHRPQGAVRKLVQRVKASVRGKTDSFADVPVDLSGRGEFSRKVLQRLRKVPAASVVTYGELARLCGNPQASRAVGRIMGSNPVPLIVPCHRCIGKDGSMTGFSTEGGVRLKAHLLFREGYVANQEHAAGIRHLRRVDPVMRKIIGRVGPYRALPDKRRPAWDALITAIVHQQLSVKAGATIAGRVKNLSSGKGYPTAAEMRAMKHETLRAAGLSNQKVSYIRDLAIKVDDGELNLNRLRHLDDQAVIEELVKVRGIGIWSAHMHLIFHLGRLDVLPTGDLGIQIAAARFYGLKEKANAAQLEEIAACWAPYRSLGSWYLWQALDAGGLG